MTSGKLSKSLAGVNAPLLILGSAATILASLTTEGLVTWDFAPKFDSAYRAALEGGKNLIYVCPPAAWATGALLEELGSRATGESIQTLVLAPERSLAAALARCIARLPALGPVHASGGIARTDRLLRTTTLRTLIVTPDSFLELLARASPTLDSGARIVVLWPEAHERLQQEEAVDAILGEYRGAQRVVVTEDELAISAFLERHAHRAPVVTGARIPEHPLPGVRYAAVDQWRVPWAVGAVLDIANPASTLLWDPMPDGLERWDRSGLSDPTVHTEVEAGSAPLELALATDLPTPEVLGVLQSAARDVVVLVRPHQLPYLLRLTTNPRVFRLPSAADDARHRGTQRRQAIRDVLDRDACERELLELAPLLDEFDPSLVAAAVLSQRDPRSTGSHQPDLKLPTWVHVRLNVGSRDRVRTADVVGALINAAGLAKPQIGRVELREGFTVVDVAAGVAEQAVAGMTGVPLRGKRVTARIDRR